MTEIPPPYGATPSCDFASQYKRVLKAAGCRTQVELASFLETERSDISAVRRRKTIPIDWLVTLFEKKRTNPNWIYCGTGAKSLPPAAVGSVMPSVITIPEIRPPEQCSAQDLVNELVRRALRDQDIESVKKELAAVWRPAKKGRPNV